MLKNCPNCGSPTDGFAAKCPYCGTYKYDFSELELNGEKPVFLKIKDGNNTYIIPARVTSMEIIVQPQPMEYITGFSHQYITTGRNDFEINLSFEGVNT